MKIKNLCTGLLCSLVLFGCQGQETNVNPEKNVEQGVTAADYFEYDIYSQLMNYYTQIEDYEQTTFLSNPMNVESDSQKLIITIYDQELAANSYEYYIQCTHNIAIDLAKQVKRLLVEEKYIQDVTIKVADVTDTIRVEVTNDSMRVDVDDAYNEMIADMDRQMQEQQEQEQKAEQDKLQGMVDSDPVVYAHNIIANSFPNYNQSSLIEMEYRGEIVYMAIVNTYVDDWNVDWNTLREIEKVNLDKTLILGFDDQDLMYDTELKEFVTVRKNVW